MGLDVHAATVAIAVAEMGGDVRSMGTVAHEIGAIRRVLGKLGEQEQLRICYEAGPTGYALYWELTRLGIECIVVAPSLIPKAASDRVKTDRRDAQKLARSHRVGLAVSPSISCHAATEKDDEDVVRSSCRYGLASATAAPSALLGPFPARNARGKNRNGRDPCSPQNTHLRRRFVRFRELKKQDNLT